MARRSVRGNSGGKLHNLVGSVIGAAFGAPPLTTEAAAYIDPEGFEQVNDVGPVVAEGGKALDAPPQNPPAQLYQEPGFFRRLFAPDSAAAADDANMSAQKGLYGKEAENYFTKRAREEELEFGLRKTDVTNEKEKELAVKRLRDAGVKNPEQAYAQLGDNVKSIGTGQAQAQYETGLLGAARARARRLGVDPAALATAEGEENRGEAGEAIFRNNERQAVRNPALHLQALDLDNQLELQSLAHQLNKRNLNFELASAPARESREMLSYEVPIPMSAPSFFRTTGGKLSLEPNPYYPVYDRGATGMPSSREQLTNVGKNGGFTPGPTANPALTQGFVMPDGSVAYPKDDEELQKLLLELQSLR